MSRCTRRVAIGVAAIATLALVAVLGGLVPVAASSGHWAATGWLLHFTMRRSVQTRALFVEDPPELADPALVLRGAGHYATGCAPCHGEPGSRPARVTRGMAPAPPALESQLGRWSPKELFWIVCHGIKFTGMPAWPAVGRHDEVWAMVAFLKRLPELAPEEYRRLAFDKPDPGSAMPSGSGGPDGDPAGVAVARARGSASVGTATRLRPVAGPLPEGLTETLADCARCHGADGLGRLPGAFPRLAGQREAYLAMSLDAFAEGTRASGIMQPIAAGLDEATRRALARHFSALPGPPAIRDGDRAAIGRGERIARLGIPARKVGACAHCHGPGTGPKNPHYPGLAGQDPRYLADQLELFAAGRRGATPWSQIMEIAIHRLAKDDARAVASYYASLQPEDRHPSGQAPGSGQDPGDLGGRGPAYSLTWLPQ